jgi:eukaryotic-like serine/threonine-protein kinase
MSRKADPTHFGGRFQVLRTLGKGGQGKVYLAEDTQLKRRVAIKTLTLDSVQPGERPARVKALLDEALIVGQLSHPNIVALYDAGLDGDMPWLVFEYVEGKPLSALIKEAGRLAPARAVDIAVQVLKAIGFAHGKGVVHRDLKPPNVMIAERETARVMDFGIAQLMQSPQEPSAPFAGTPAYMAPEYIAGQPYTARSDLFCVGMLLYQMLTGKPAATGNNAYEILHKVANEAFAPPSQANPEVDERLDDLVMKALSKDPAARYASAAEMEHALYRYLSPEAAVEAETGQGTLDFLLRRMRYKSDFPALSSTMSAVNRTAASQTERVAQLSSCILKDFALTNKLLRLVNSAHFQQFGNISTVSRAVVILGFDNVRNVAITLLLFEHLQNKAQAAQLKDEIMATYFSALVARELTAKAGVKDPEEAFICAMFHKLGRLLTAFYFHEEYQEIQKRCEAGREEEQASAQVLGISFEELGLGVARAWHFPERLTNTLRRAGDERARKPQNEEQRLRVLSELASGITSAVRAPETGQTRSRLGALAAQFGDSLGIPENALTAAARNAAATLADDPGLLNFKPAQSALYQALQEWGKPASEPQAAAASSAPDALEHLVSEATLQDVVPGNGHAAAAPNAQAILTAGIQDITNTLVGTYELNDLLRIILETMYRGMGFTRVLLCIRDPAQNALRGRFGFGLDVDQIIKRGFSIPLAPARNAFYAAISQGADVYIEDVDGDKIKEHIPDWYRKLVPARSLALFPILINKKPVGLFYADCDESGAIRFQSGELSLLKTLRNQAVLAIKTHS